MKVPEPSRGRSYFAHPVNGPLSALLILLTFGTGLIYAISIIGLGRVFVANMTGNIVFIGFALAKTPDYSLWGSLVALAAFLVGAVAGGSVILRFGAHRGKLLRNALMVQLALFIVALYQSHRPDPHVPYADSIGAIRDLLNEGVIQLAGISNASVEQIDLANRILDGRLASVQNQFSPAHPSSLAELQHCAALGIAFLPWSLLGGISNAAQLGSRHTALAQVAADHGVSPQQVTLAWELALAPVVIPIPGASPPASIQDSAKATELTLTAAEIAALTAPI